MQGGKNIYTHKYNLGAPALSLHLATNNDDEMNDKAEILFLEEEKERV